MKKYCYLNGQILPFNQASLKLNDIGVLRNYNGFHGRKSMESVVVRNHLFR